MKANRLLIGALAVGLGLFTLAVILRLLGLFGTPAVARKDPAAYRPTKIEALGRLEPASGVIQVGVPMGDRLRTILVHEGDQVKEGQALAVLESIDARKAEKDLAASQLQEAESRLQAIEANGQSQIKEAELKLELIKQVDPLDLKAQEEKITLVRAQLERAAMNLKRLEAFKPGTIPEQDLENQRLQVRQATFELQAAEALLEKMKKTQTLNLEGAEAQLKSARTSLERARKEIPIDSLKQNVRLAEERVRNATVQAPTAGQILKINSRAGELVGSAPILRMADTRHMVVIAEVYETDVRFLRSGLRAQATSPALANQTMEGTVSYIGSSIARNYVYDIDPRADVDRRVVEVKIRLDSAELAARYINLQVQVVIPLEGDKP